MPTAFQILRCLPISRERKTEWRRRLLDRAYAKDVTAARTAKDKEKVASLESDHQFELQLDREEEDERLTRFFLRQARRLHVPTPSFEGEDGKESEYWYEGPLTYRRLLTTVGIAKLRDEIRKERKARHESRAIWVPWLSAITGLAGAITGLVAILKQ